MKTETINILIQSKGRMAPHVEKVFKNNKLKIVKQSERSLIGKVKGYPSLKILFTFNLRRCFHRRVLKKGEFPPLSY